MSEVKRYYANLDHGTLYAPRPGCDAEIVKASDFDRVTAECDALQERLNAADQGKDDLETQNKLLRHDLASNLETFAAICTKLGIDVEAASDAPGKPSDVFVAHVNNLVIQLNDREASRYDWLQAAQAAEKRVEELRSELAERDALLERCRLAVTNGEDFDLPASLLEEIKALSASAEPAAPRETPAPFAFVYVHPQTAERHTVTVTRDEVAEHMEEQLFQKLCECFCECQPVGETNVVDCRCDEVAEQFKLVKENEGLSISPAEPDAPVAQYPNRLCHIEHGAHPYRCGCLKGDKEAQRIYDEHCKPVEHDERADFERTASSHKYLKQFGVSRFPEDGDDYDAIPLQGAWDMWQARAALERKS
ncbi:hypothetical protein K5F93_20220 [Pseudomonas protegens]|uniref:hypothetical protein n=1 Tax=Pseudomonas protegens TaxID=380021 RepID=UPI001C8E988B|nr:hypothetical protein [Pseudomonas protegens]QZI68711.1 hypothetical protein K5F93_20220 [Pseudomonas protegens]